MSHRHALVAAIVVLAASSEAEARDYFVAPNGGSMQNDGTEANPWSTAEEVIAAGKLGADVQPGDRLVLASGYHGEIVISGGTYDPPIIITGDTDATPEVRRVRVGGASGLVIRGLSISPSHAASYESLTMVDIQGSASNVTVENCTIFSEADASGWSAAQWIDRPGNGIQVSGDDITIRGNTVRNVRFGISASGERSLIARNTIDGFSADGLRGLGDHEVFEYNVVKNCYVDGDLDSNHDDGFQSWSVGSGGVGTGEVVGVVLRGNVILNYDDPNHPFRATMQGVGCFDGTFVDWVIENNVVITDHWHGITLLGARNSRIVNNTVIDVNEETPGPPWISIDAHKDGTAPSGCLVRNNLATDFANASSGVTEDHNFVIDDPLSLFVDPANHDLRLLADADVIDQGSSDQAPGIDQDGIPRPQGDEVDPGAFEWHEEDVMPVDGGVGAGGSTSSGGATGAGGSISSGGNTGSSGAGGVASGSGGSGAGAGGNAGSPGGAGASGFGGGSGGPVAGADGGLGASGSDDDSGCGCRLVGGAAGGRAASAVVFVFGLLAVRRRRRRAALRRQPV